MKTIVIHGKNVQYDESDPSQVHAAHWMEKNADNARAILDEAHHDHSNNMAHFTTTNPAGYNGATKFHAEHVGHDTYTLGVSHHHSF